MTIPRPWLGGTGIALVLLVTTNVAGQPERRGRAAPRSDLEGSADAPVPDPSAPALLGGPEPFEAFWPDEPAATGSTGFESDASSCSRANDCAWSEECRDAGRCVLNGDDQRCYDGKRRRDGSMVIFGSVVMGAGLIAGVAAIPIWGEGVECGGEWGLICTSDSGHNEAAVGLAITGGVTLALGTGFLIYGVSKVPDRDAVVASRVWQPEVRLGLTGGSLQWRF